MSSPRPNLRTIAQEAGVSVATVSLALREHPSIPVVTRHRIQQVANAMGYRPNARVAELMGEIRRNRRVDGVTETVGMLWSDATMEEVQGYAHLVEFETAARRRLELQGYGLDIFYYEKKGLPRTEHVLQARGIRGLILAPLITLPHRHLPWDWNQFSVMIAGSGLWRPDFHRVRFNHFEEMMLILHHLRHRRAEKIGLITERMSDMRSQRAVAGGFLAHVGDRVRSSMYESTGEDRAALLRWLRRTKPDILIIGSSSAAWWVLESRVETQIVMTCQYLHPDWKKYPGIRQDYGQLGSVTAEQLITQLMMHRCGPPERAMKTYIMGRWDGVAWPAAE